MRDWSEVDRGKFVFTLVCKPGFNHVRREYVADQKPVVILLQSVEHFTKRPWSALNLRRFLGLKLIEVLIDRFTGIDLVPDSVQTGHQLSRKA